MMAFRLRLALLGLLAGLWLPVSAQIAPKDSSNTNPNGPITNAVTDPASIDIFPHFTPKSPTAAALSRYGEYPVSLYTGLPTIEIPIYEFKVGTTTVPIKLTYHAAGNKINALASWVGLGWSLQTGGNITRSVMSRPDEQSNGVLGQTINTPAYTSCQSTTSIQEAKYLADNTNDSQRDVFMYSTPTASNSFIMPSINSAVLLNSEPVSISASSGLSSFTIVDATGTRFRYSDSEASFFTSTSPYGATSFTSTWLLNEIVSLNSSERATYTYTSIANLPTAIEYNEAQIIIADLQDTGSSGIQTGDQGKKSYNTEGTIIQGRYLQEIQFPGGKISFALEANTRPDGGKALDYIDVYNYDIGSGSFARIKRFDFLYTTKNRTNGDAVTFLDAVQLIQGDGTTVVGSYSLSYNTTALPAVSSFAKDYWGYYNSNSATTFIPAQSQTFTYYLNAPANTTTLAIGGANREPDETKMKAWVLQSIRYPTGGSTQFDFEAHRYLSNGTQKLAGGLRIKQIRNYTAPNQLASTKTYKYGTKELGQGTFRAQIIIPQNQNIGASISSVLTIQNNSTYSYKSYSFSSSPSYPLLPDEGSPVTYPEVTEYREDGNGNNLGKTVYQYRDAASDNYFSVGAGKGFLMSRSWNRGQLLTQAVTDASGKLRAKTVNTYGNYGTGNTSTLAGALVNRSTLQVGTHYPGSNCTGFIDDIFIPIQTYSFYFGNTRLISTTDTTYADDNSGKYTLKVTETDYDAGFYLPTETRLKAEGGIVLGSKTVYAQNYASVPANATSPELLGIRALQQRNAYLPIETVTYRKESTSTSPDYKTGKITSYTTVTLNGLMTALPYKTYLLESVYNTFSSISPYKTSAQLYTESSYNNSSFPIDARYVLRLTMAGPNNSPGYDANGNPIGYTVASGASTSFTYASQPPTGGIPFWVLTQQTQNAGQSPSLTTSYTYSRPLLGPASITDPRNVTTYYVYDNFGRLSTIKDHDGNVLKQYTYRYATQP